MSQSNSIRETYGLALVSLGSRNKDIVVLEADLGKSTRSALFKEKFPDRYFDVGIAEQNMASVAAGFALSGKIPFINSFAVFASGRAFDQIRGAICIPNLRVRIGGSSCGLSDFGDGKTHQSLEDMAIMRALPNMAVLCPVDAVEMGKMMDCLESWPGPAYIRINRNDLPNLYPAGEPYHIGKATRFRDGKDVAIFACGTMVSRALDAAESLERDGVGARVMNVSSIKPLDREAVIDFAEGAKAIVTAEEHTVLGGLGSAIAEALRSERGAPIDFIGIQDQFGRSARNYEELLEAYGLTAAAISAAARRLLG
ncbi:MAG: transketolase C-terminal domain-containing protein [Rectinemataceae bacterium]|jgi:transketolase